jgi:hypothetical protein
MANQPLQNVITDPEQIATLMTYCTYTSSTSKPRSWLTPPVDNGTICTERMLSDKAAYTTRRIIPMSHELAQKLPKSIIDCILGIAAVHMAVRNPGNAALERLALETKVNVLQNHNRRLHMPHDQAEQRPDVLISSGLLIYAMDVCIHL